MLCKYRNLLGKPDEGIHSYRIFNIAIVDVVLTILGAYVLAKYVGKCDFWRWLGILFLLGIILHRIFCVNTTINKMLFGTV